MACPGVGEGPRSATCPAMDPPPTLLILLAPAAAAAAACSSARRGAPPEVLAASSAKTCSHVTHVIRLLKAHEAPLEAVWQAQPRAAVT